MGIPLNDVGLIDAQGVYPDFDAQPALKAISQVL
jgi:hypothetical protein